MSVNYVVIGLGNVFPPVQRKAITNYLNKCWLVALGTNLSKILIKIQTCSLMKIHLKVCQIAAIFFQSQCVTADRLDVSYCSWPRAVRASPCPSSETYRCTYFIHPAMLALCRSPISAAVSVTESLVFSLIVVASDTARSAHWIRLHTGGEDVSLGKGFQYFCICSNMGKYFFILCCCKCSMKYAILTVLLVSLRILTEMCL